MFAPFPPFRSSPGFLQLLTLGPLRACKLSLWNCLSLHRKDSTEMSPLSFMSTDRASPQQDTQALQIPSPWVPFLASVPVHPQGLW